MPSAYGRRHGWPRWPSWTTGTVIMGPPTTVTGHQNRHLGRPERSSWATRTVIMGAPTTVVGAANRHHRLPERSSWVAGVVGVWGFVSRAPGPASGGSAPALLVSPGARGAAATAGVVARLLGHRWGARRGWWRVRGGGVLHARQSSLGPGSHRWRHCRCNPVAGRDAGDLLPRQAPGMLPVPGPATWMRERRQTVGRVGCGERAQIRDARRGLAGRVLPARLFRQLRPVPMSASHSSPSAGQSATTSLPALRA
jgi:hypothetical protein